ncbi:hypothetical protein CNYM01_13981 [Colletotrichum nymphaeae SA-01]|uniref:Uncharacterized protein n=1 Tax=Colletotrichum nymphaeae SA-01 TaxID=1460502 RepID=A0A135U0Z1_9PEZI|nr:hypothetical protein CNYM01_13981 [Colletotrichum nymphaeae SA-01]
MSGNQFSDRNTRSPSLFDLNETDESDDGDSSPHSRSAATQDDMWMSRLSEPSDPQAVLDRKLPSTKTFEAVDTDVVVSVTDRSQRDLVKRFDELDVDWAILPNSLDIPGLRDDALREYSDWQCSKVRGEELKMEFRKARDLALKDGLDLELIHKVPDPTVFIERGVRRGIAMRFVGDVEDWAKNYSHG